MHVHNLTLSNTLAHTHKYFNTHKQAESAVAALAVGFRFSVAKAVNEQAPPGLDKQIYDAADKGKLDELLGLCQQWAGHAVIDAYKNKVIHDTNTNTNICLLFYSPNQQTNASCSCLYCE